MQRVDYNSNQSLEWAALGPVCVASAVNKLEQWDVEVIDEDNLGKFGPRSGTVGPTMNSYKGKDLQM